MRKVSLFLALVLTACTRHSEVPVAIDGDTIQLDDGQPSIRLAGIDAPELPGHCRRGRVCVPGDPYASRAHLQYLLDGPGQFHCRVIEQDHYGRDVAYCYKNNINLSNEMLTSGHARRYLWKGR